MGIKKVKYRKELKGISKRKRIVFDFGEIEKINRMKISYKKTLREAIASLDALK